MNVSVGIDTDGDSGVLKLADGNDYVSLSDAMASIDGVKTVIGSAEDEELGVVYFFVHNSNNNHAIFAYSAKTNTYRLIFSHPSLNFSSTGFVKGDVVRVKRKLLWRRRLFLETKVTTEVTPTSKPKEEVILYHQILQYL